MQVHTPHVITKAPRHGGMLEEMRVARARIPGNSLKTMDYSLI